MILVVRNDRYLVITGIPLSLSHSIVHIARTKAFTVLDLKVNARQPIAHNIRAVCATRKLLPSPSVKTGLP
jgi:hypothetical protein